MLLSLRTSSLALLLLAGSVAKAADPIVWASSYELAQQVAAQANRPMWIAFWPRQAYAQDPLPKTAYRDKRVQNLAKDLVPVFCAPWPTGFGRASKAENRAAAVWAELREKLFKQGPDARPPAPQHVFLSSKGEILFATPFLLRPGELAWALREALRRSGVQVVSQERDERAPHNLWLGELLRKPGRNEPLPSEVKAALAKLDDPMKFLRSWRESLPGVLVSDDRKAQQILAGRLKGARRGLVRSLLEAVARDADPSWAGLALPWIDYRDERMRRRAYGVLRELRPAKALRSIRAQYRQEKTPEMRGRALRAWVRVSPRDKHLSKALRQSLKLEAPVQLRLHATLALADFADRELAMVQLGQCLRDPNLYVRGASAWAISARQEQGLFPELERALEREREGAGQKLLQRALLGREKPQSEEFRRLVEELIRGVEKG
ncbi:MAG: hypothetical protein CSA62_03235 [Planctomycetota bacterium]|nr:MAG: hypothetical protein CSA62_03235 [Planctomycetota bacterium]